MNFVNKFAQKHPKLAEWIRKGGLFVIFSYVVTFIKMLLLMFLPALFRGMVGNAEWLWPNIPVKVLGVKLNLAIIGNALATDAAGVVTGGLAFTLANLTTIFIGEFINFPLQRNITFKSHGNPIYQALWYFIAWVVISLICNGFNNLWMPIASVYVAPAIYNILVTFITGGVSMVIFFFVFKIIFPEGEK